LLAKKEMSKLRILVLGNANGIVEGLNGFLAGDDVIIHRALNTGEAFSILEEQTVDLALVELHRFGESGPNFLKLIKSKYPELETLVIDDTKELVNSQGFYSGLPNNDSLPESQNWSELQRILGKTRSFSKYQHNKEQMDSDFSLFSKILKEKEGLAIVGLSSTIKKISSLIILVSKSDDTSVIITGESGTGKELVARGIHALSKRCKGPFNAVNCSAIPDTLFESEFFGYRKGAFTGALEKSMGWFEQADNGTLFLDEVSELSLTMQGKLLRVLDDKTIYKIGSREEIKLNLRVVSATNKDITELLDQNSFRLDLFHRLNAFHIHIPPLRERKEDIPVLLDYYCKEFSKKQRKSQKPIDDQVLERLSNYSFPGNVRELKNMVERAVITCEDVAYRVKDFPIKAIRKSTTFNLPIPPRSLNLQEVEKKAVSDALEKSAYNITKAAAMLSISRQGLYRKMEKFNIPNKEITRK
jgi:DNA-binding NtrC family response regulator